MKKNGTLYLVSTAIGNPDDISLRAIRVLKSVDLILCEEWKHGKALLRFLDHEVELLNFNEHNHSERIPEIIDLLKQGKTIALTSDCGTPVFSDPGLDLVQACYKNQIEVTAVPGASSLMNALVLSGFPVDSFRSLGWLSPKRELRDQQLRQLIHETETTVIMETPYRLVQLLESCQQVLGGKRVVAVCSRLTTEHEEVRRAELNQVLKHFKHAAEKMEFVLVIAGKNFKD
ncbi:MAG: 16S rRNA (cytidine(1402)-2'-O)-methyltransferase [Calditrichaeota bacterium]|nr:16S rRNA (cytidine(1402)-2'-O)-methyltransferase [Calditrichota bacterium]